MSKDKLIPALRFPEFKNEGEWRPEKLSIISEVIMGSSPSSTSYNENRIGIPLLQGNADIKNRLSAPRIYTTEVTKECKIDDILLSVRAPVGTVAKSLHKACIGRGISALRALKPNSQEYLYQWLFSYEASWQKVSQGGTFDAVNSDDIRNLLVPTPNPQEQQKIASCLSSIDELIAAHSQKLDLLKDHKKGLMQNLFPTNSITNEQSITNYESSITDKDDQFVIRNSPTRNLPKYRFKEFENDGVWVEDALDHFCFSISSGKDKNQDNGVFNLYGSTGIIGSTENSSYNGDFILVARVGANAGFLNRVIGEFGVTDNTLVVNLKEPELTDFIFYSLDKIGLNKLVFGSGQPLVTGTQLKELTISMPKSPKEQQKIASCLSSLDALITAQAEKIEQLKLHKKGLMQGMFPKSITN